MPNAIVIIPARAQSTRLPLKMLLKATGKTLIQHTWEAALKAKLPHDVYVATDDAQIQHTVLGFGGKAIMTSVSHKTGTDRITEAVNHLRLDENDIVINIQGDEPEIEANAIDYLIELLIVDENAKIATLATPITDPALAHSPSCVKVVRSKTGRALYFSRALIPYHSPTEKNISALQHIGIYAYRVSYLKMYKWWPQPSFEIQESLEQLRTLDNNYHISVGLVQSHQKGIDTLEDYNQFVERYASKPIH